MEDQKTTQGGAREGAGRPRKDPAAEKAVPAPASIYPSELELIKEAYGSPTKALKFLAEELRKKKEKLAKKAA